MGLFKRKKKRESTANLPTSSTSTSQQGKESNLLDAFEGNKDYLITHSIESKTAWILDAETHTPLLGVAVDKGTQPFTVTLTINQVANTADFDDLIERLQKVYKVIINRKFLYLQEAEPSRSLTAVSSGGLTTATKSDSVFIPEELLPKTVH